MIGIGIGPTFSRGKVGANPSFITRWNLLAGDTLTLPTTDAGNNYVVDWGDGSATETVNSATAPSHIYASDGTYDITLTGTCPSWNVNNSMTNRQKCVEVVNWGQMGFTTLNFWGFQIATLPVGSITGAENVTNLSACFRANSINSIPLGLFDKCPNVTNLSDCFLGNSITSIPLGLFDNCPNITNFTACFRANSITSIPLGLFDNCPNITNLVACFRANSITSIPLGLFDNCPNIAQFRDCFRANSITSSVPELWLRNPNPPLYDTGSPGGLDCYADNPNIANIADIPLYWR